MKRKELGQPIVSEHTIGAAFTNYKGKNYICTTVSGVPARLNIYNLDDDKVIVSTELSGALNSWNHRINVDGNLYVVAKGMFFKYDFSLNKFKSYGKIKGSTECFVMDNDEEGNLYLGSCFGGNIYKYDISKDEIIDLGTVTKNAVYVRAISYLNGFLYCGIKGENFAAFYRVNAKNPSEKKEIIIPPDEEYYPDGLSWIYTTNVVDNKIVILAMSNEDSKLLIYDTDCEKFLSTGYKGDFPGLYVSPVLNGKSYFACNNKLMEIDVRTGKVSESDFPEIKSERTAAIDFITDEKSGEKLLAILNNKEASVEIIDLKTKTTYSKKLNLHKAAYYIQTMESGDFINGDRGIYLSAYCGENAVRYDLDTGKYRLIKIGQCEGMVGCNGKQYMGVYPHDRLYIYDYKSDLDTPEFKGVMSKGQDRPFAMCKGDECVFMGSVPCYGRRGGDIVIFNTVSSVKRIIKEPIKEQSIISLDYKDGLLYGSTSVWGGLSAAPDSKDAKIFIYDLRSDTVILAFTPEIPGIKNPTWIGGITVDNYGNIWGVTGNTLFYLDIKSKKVLKYVSFGEYTYSQVKHRWRPTYIRFDSEGNIFVNALGIHKVDIKTMEHKRVTPETDRIFLFTLDDKDNIYYAADNNFYLIEREEKS